MGVKLPNYLSELKAGTKPLEAFEKAYGMDVQTFHRLARNYWNKDAFASVSFKGSEALLNPSVSVRRLAVDEASLLMAKGQQNFMSMKNAKKLKRTFASLREALGPTPEVLNGQAHAAVVLKDYDVALEFAGEAKAQLPQNAQVLSMWGHVNYLKLYDISFKDMRKDTPHLFSDSQALYSWLHYLIASVACERHAPDRSPKPEEPCSIYQLHQTFSS